MLSSDESDSWAKGVSDPGDGRERPWLRHYESQVPAEVQVPPSNLHALLEETAREHSLSVATIFFGERVTYSQLDYQAGRFAAGLIGLGVERGDRVAVLLPNSPQAVISIFGALKAGAIAVPLSPGYGARDLSAALADSGAKIVVALDTQASRVREAMSGTRVEHLVIATMQSYLTPMMGLMLTLRQQGHGTFPGPITGENIHQFLDLARNATLEIEQPRISADDPAVLLYTEGTTGTPRGVALTHANLVANTMQVSAWLWDSRPERKDIYLSAVPFSHPYGLTMALNLPIAVAGTMAILPRFTAKEALRAIARFRVTVLPAVPLMLDALVDHPLAERHDLRTLRMCVSGETSLPPELAHSFEGLTGARVIEAYGLSEATGVTHCNPAHGERRDGSIGLPLPSTGARVLHEQTGEAQPPGEVGELVVRGPQVMSGYWGREVDTGETVREGWLYTEDLARMDEDGYFYLVDRKGDVIQVGEASIYPGEIEAVFCSSEKVREALVAAVPDERGYDRLTAFVVLKDDAEATDRELLRFAAERLDPEKTPTRVEFREDLPHSPLGKRLRRQIIEGEIEGW